MCFGNSQQTQSTTQTSTPPEWLTNAAAGNVKAAQGLGFTPYSGPQVAGFSPEQTQSFDLGSNWASSVAPYVGQSGQLISNYANAGPQSVNPSTIASKMSPYMNQYVMQALTPQLQAQDVQFAGQNKAVDAAATGAGAFGDTGWGQLRGTTTQAQDAARAGLIGNAYNSAFNTAIGAGAQDVATDLAGQTTNANLAETALGRQLTGATALNNTALGATNLINTLGGQQTAQTQAQLNAAYNQYLMAQQFPFQQISAEDQALAAARGAVPTSSTSTTSAPNNSGYGVLGSVLGGVAGSIFPGVGTALGASIGGGLGGMFGGGSGAPLTGQPSPNGPGTYALGYADGGKVKKGKPILVGERGPEVIVPKKDGLVIPNEVMAAAREKRAAKTGSPDGLSRQLGIAA